ncbi:MAG TPA: Maf family nucleotide pyrophosphatase [Marinagarivorans sp.]|nr:Maf family nucleotide pyrophosphatase [Marinagarivorans sp.]
MTDSPMPPIVLASSSSYRKALLSRLMLPFNTVQPDIDETPQACESPQALCERLSRAKAAAVSGQYSQAIVIGSDQVAALGTQLLGKPGNRARAFDQLTNCSGRPVDFFTGLCVQLGGTQLFHLAHTRVHFRTLTPAEINRYIDVEMPLDCAGSFKAEGLGICLFDRITSSDPTDLIGLPLIALTRMLREVGVNPLIATA